MPHSDRANSPEIGRAEPSPAQCSLLDGNNREQKEMTRKAYSFFEYFVSFVVPSTEYCSVKSQILDGHAAEILSVLFRVFRGSV